MIDPLTVLREEDRHFPVLIYAGRDLGPTQVVDEAVAWLEAQGADEWTVHEARTAARPIRDAFWGGPDLGFVGEAHPDAVPVTCVHFPGIAIPEPKG